MDIKKFSIICLTILGCVTFFTIIVPIFCALFIMGIVMVAD